MKIGWIILGTAIVGGGIYLYNLNTLSVDLNPVVNARIHKVGATGITVAIDTILKNPTKSSLTIKQPYVEIIYKGSKIASSQVSDKNIPIPRFGQEPADTIMLELPYIQLLLKAKDLYTSFTDGKPVIVQVKVITYYYISGGLKKYERTENVTLYS